MDPKELPYEIKTGLVSYSKKLPRNCDRQSFCKNAGRRICELAQELVINNKYTLFYAAVGAILGCAIKKGIKRIWGVGWVLGPVADSLPVMLGLGGAAKGFLKDCDDAALKRKILRIVEEELNRAEA